TGEHQAHGEVEADAEHQSERADEHSAPRGAHQPSHQTRGSDAVGWPAGRGERRGRVRVVQSRISAFADWLRDRDSNPDHMIQSQVSYHWTIPQRKCGLQMLAPEATPSIASHPQGVTWTPAADLHAVGAAIRGTTSRSAAARGVIPSRADRAYTAS